MEGQKLPSGGSWGPEAPWALGGSWSCLLVLILPSFLEVAVDRGLGLLGRTYPGRPPVLSDLAVGGAQGPSVGGGGGGSGEIESGMPHLLPAFLSCPLS